MTKGILTPIHRPVVWFQVSCIKQHNELIIDLFSAPNIHHLFIKFDQKFLNFLGETLIISIIIVIVYKTYEQNLGFRPKFLRQT